MRFGHMLLAGSLVMMLANSAFGITPPNGLQWDMNYEKSKAQVESKSEKGKTLEVKDQKIVKEGMLHGFTSAEIKGVKINDRKTKTALLFFDSVSQSLAGVYYMFSWDNEEDEKEVDAFSSKGKGRSKAWQFQQDLAGILSAKYGAPTRDETQGAYGREMESKVELETVWSDSTDGAAIGLVITRVKTNLGIGRLDEFQVHLMYQSPGLVTKLKSDIAESDDL